MCLIVSKMKMQFRTMRNHLLTSLWRSKASCLAAGPNPVKDLALIFSCKLLRHREKTEKAKHLSCFTTENAASRLPVSKSTWRICWIGTTWPGKKDTISHNLITRSNIFTCTCKSNLPPWCLKTHAHLKTIQNNRDWWSERWHSWEFKGAVKVPGSTLPPCHWQTDRQTGR